VTEEGKTNAAADDSAIAAEEIRAAEKLLATGFPRIALTRAYFAVFHAVRARVYAEGLEPRTHSGTLHLFNVHFVKTGTYEAATSRLVARLQKFREEADYSRSFVIDDSGAREEIEAARGLVDRILGDLTEGKESAGP
jgi:uncharacterized protein (UPF0332 family)